MRLKNEVCLVDRIFAHCEYLRTSLYCFFKRCFETSIVKLKYVQPIIASLNLVLHTRSRSSSQFVIEPKRERGVWGGGKHRFLRVNKDNENQSDTR